MTVAELIAKLKELPQDATVLIWTGASHETARDQIRTESREEFDDVYADITCTY